jgi:hypothetical protein
MRRMHICLLSALLLLPSGCGTVKKIIGWGGSKEEQTKKPPTTTRVARPSPEKARITTTTLSKWALYAAITLVVLLGIRYGVKSWATNKKE